MKGHSMQFLRKLAPLIIVALISSPVLMAQIPGGGGGSGTVTAAGTNGTLAQAVQGINGGVPFPIPTFTITSTPTAITANTPTTIAAANAQRKAATIQCASGAVVVSENGATLASSTFGATGQTIYIPTGTDPAFLPPGVSTTAITAYTATAQTCVVTEYSHI